MPREKPILVGGLCTRTVEGSFGAGEPRKPLEHAFAA